MIIDNPDGGEIQINGSPFSPVSHGDETKVYAYLTGENHTITMNGITRTYCFNPLDNSFYPGNSITDYLDFTISGGEYGVDYNLKNGILTILTEKPLTISNKTENPSSQRIAVANGLSANITLSGVYIDVSSTNNACAFKIGNNSTGNVSITLEGTNTLKSGSWNAGLQKNGTVGSLTIGGTGSLTATGGSESSGIGGGWRGNTANITINSGTVTAAGGSRGAGIGSGSDGSASGITINGGTVTATGGNYGAGIGSGSDGSAAGITINGGTVTATGSSSGAGIGSSARSTSDIIISGGSVKTSGINVTPTNGTENVYPLVIDNISGAEILIDGKAFTPTSHGDEAKVYAYLTG